MLIARQTYPHITFPSSHRGLKNRGRGSTSPGSGSHALPVPSNNSTEWRLVGPQGQFGAIDESAVGVGHVPAQPNRLLGRHAARDELRALICRTRVPTFATGAIGNPAYLTAHVKQSRCVLRAPRRRRSPLVGHVRTVSALVALRSHHQP